jgi:Na+-transporting NADH:ubiquinone oxidoreductase subunit A
MIKIKKGLDLPITGEPRPVIEPTTVKTAALVGGDYHDLKPSLLVKVGDRVQVGQAVFFDKQHPEVKLTAPVSGVVSAIHRGDRRLFESVVIAVDGKDERRFPSHREGELAQLKADVVQERLLESGLWTAFRTRPFSKIPQPHSTPHSIFVTTMDSNPLAPDPAIVIKGQERYLLAGLKVLTRLTTGKVFVCRAPDLKLDLPKESSLTEAVFQGPHPAGLAGTHIHFLDPVSIKKTVWTLAYQDVIAIGYLFLEGRYNAERVISLAGPMVREPKHYRTVLGASIEELCRGRIKEGEVRLVSGSVFAGRTAIGTTGYLGRYHQQIVALREGREREFLGWQKPGLNKFSIKRVFASVLTPGKKYPFDTSTGGSVRALVPIGSYEQVLPLDIEPNFLLKSLLSGDTDMAQQLGVLELDEEDVGLLTFVCPTKLEYGPLLRRSLATIEQEG